MKKLVFFSLLSVLLMFFGVVNAQQYDNKMSDNETFRNWYPIVTDTITPTDSIIEKIIFLDKDYKYSYNVQFAADTVTADGTVSFFLQGSFDGYKYYAVDTVTWSMSADTVGLMTGSAVSYRFLKLKMVGNKPSTQRANFKRSCIAITKD